LAKVQVEELGKQYPFDRLRAGCIGGKQERYRTLSDALVSPFRRVGKLLRGQAYAAAETNETIWALKKE